MNIFNERVKMLMNELGINAEELGRKLNVAPSLIRRWCKNSNSISLSHAIIVCDFFQCSLDYLSGRSDVDIKTSFLPAPNFNEHLRELLKKEKVTVYRICKETSLSMGYFHRWFHGSDPKLYTLNVLADYLNVTLDYLVGRE